MWGCASSFLLQDNPLSIPKRPLADSEAASMQLKYYSTEMHTAAFVLPSFLKKVRSYHQPVSPQTVCTNREPSLLHTAGMLPL